MEHSNIINIKPEDIEDNLNNILNNSNIFKRNSDIGILQCIIFYVDSKNVLGSKKYELKLRNNTLLKSELISLILENKKNQSKDFDLTGIYKFEINLKEDEIKTFCNNPEKYSFMKQYTRIQDIQFNPGLEIFNDANNIIFFFTKKTKNGKNNSSANKTRKKVKFSNETSSSQPNHSKTSKNKT